MIANEHRVANHCMTHMHTQVWLPGLDTAILFLCWNNFSNVFNSVFFVIIVIVSLPRCGSLLTHFCYFTINVIC